MGDKTWEFRSTTSYKYDTENRVTEYDIYNTENVLTKYMELFYDSSGNMIKTQYYQGGELSFIDTYEYDTMKNPLNFINNDISVYNLSPNNVIKHSYVNLMIDNNDYIREYYYEYNEDNFPISRNSNSYKVIFQYY